MEAIGLKLLLHRRRRAAENRVEAIGLKLLLRRRRRAAENRVEAIGLKLLLRRLPALTIPGTNLRSGICGRVTANTIAVPRPTVGSIPAVPWKT